MKFLIRADASAKIGTGHVMRMFGLGEQLLADNHQVTYYMAECPWNVLEKAPQGCDVLCNPEITELVPEEKGAITVVDSYKLKAPDNGVKINDTWFFLREEIKTIRRGRSKCENVLVSFGGANALESEAESYSGTDRNRIRASSFKDYAANLAWADIVVGAGGVSALERAYLGIPSLIALIAENQKFNQEWLCSKFAAIKITQHGVDEQSEWIARFANHRDLVELMSRKAMQAVPNDSYQAFWAYIKEHVLC